MSLEDERTPLLIRSVKGHTTFIGPSTQRNIACGAILVAEMFERLANFSLSGNLVFFLTKEPLCWESSLATTAVLTFTAVMYITGLFGGWISDSYLGRFATIIVGYVIYGMGYAFFPWLAFYAIQTYDPTDTVNDQGSPCNGTWLDNKSPPFCSSSVDDGISCQVVIFIAISLVAVGSGIVRTNLAPFGGDQAREGGQLYTQRFFTGYYWSINFGGLFALVGVAMLQNVNFFAGYLVAFVSLVFSFISFLIGTKFYIRRPAGAINVFRRVFDVIHNAFHVRRTNLRARETVQRFLDYANLEHDGGNYNVNQIDDVRQLWKIFKVFLLMIPYWICYSQMSFSVFLLQGLHMRLDFHNISDFHMTAQRDTRIQNIHICNESHANSGLDKDSNKVAFPPASLAVFNGLFIVITLPLIQRFYRFLSSRNIKALTWRRIWVGMFLATLALVAGAILEYFRLSNIYDCGFYRQLVGNTVYDAAPNVSILWQIPQYCLLGASEVFFIVTGIEYAYMESPINMQGIVMGLFWFAGGVGTFIGVALPYIFHDIGHIWIDPVYINCNRLDYYFFILAAFLFIFSFIFVGVSKYVDLGLGGVIVEGRNNRFQSEPDSLSNTPQLRRRQISIRSVNNGSTSSLG